jgi:hypothetical protein
LNLQIADQEIGVPGELQGKRRPPVRFLYHGTVDVHASLCHSGCDDLHFVSGGILVAARARFLT